MQKPRHLKFAGDVQQHLRAQDVGSNEGAGIVDTAVDVALGGKIDDSGDSAANRDPDRLSVADVPFDEAVTRIALDLFEVCQVTRVSEQIEIDNARVGIGLQQIANEIAADEAATAGHQHGKHSGPFEPRERSNERPRRLGLLQYRGCSDGSQGQVAGVLTELREVKALGGHAGNRRADADRCGCRRRRRVQHVDHPVCANDSEIVDESAAGIDGLSANAGASARQVLAP